MMLRVLIAAFTFLMFGSTGMIEAASLKKSTVAKNVRAAIAAVGVSLFSFSPVNADQIVCRVDLQPGVSPPEGSNSALYLTARQDVGVWRSAVRNMKPPPILSSRTAGPLKFPIEIILDTEKDATPEGIALKNEWLPGRLPITVSARLDTDGVASTRDPTDLVGMGTSSKDGDAWSSPEVVLQDRGIGGRFVTNKNK
jgi:hypothetical protein